MPLVDFVISNPGHHAAMMQPVLAQLKSQDAYYCRVISLCAFRGFASPVSQFETADEFISIPARQMRSSSSTGKQSGNRYGRWLRQIARQLSWWLVLRRPFRHALATPPHLLILPNDTAFPYDHLTRLLHLRHIPFMLMQEGIRFPLPTDEGQDAYGSGGAVAIAAWGESSAAYFRAQGAPPETIHCTGSPRFDHILSTDWRPQADKLVAEYGFGRTNLLFLSNPIDDQGFCTTAEKMVLIHRFLSEIAPLFADPDFHLILKLHPRESVTDFQATAAAFPFHPQISVLGRVPLYPLFTLATAAIVLASTVGLEALLHNLPLGVLEILGAGFVYDYVSSGAATGISWQQSVENQVKTLLTGQTFNPEMTSSYISRNLAMRSESTATIVALIEKLVPL
jgi:hypothetical protein